jgi:hypothetical protein
MTSATKKVAPVLMVAQHTMTKWHTWAKKPQVVVASEII